GLCSQGFLSVKSIPQRRLLAGQVVKQPFDLCKFRFGRLNELVESRDLFGQAPSGLRQFGYLSVQSRARRLDLQDAPLLCRDLSIQILTRPTMVPDNHALAVDRSLQHGDLSSQLSGLLERGIRL